MYLRRPLCVFTLLFVLMLTILRILFGDSGGGGHDKYAGREITVEGTVKSIENKNGRSVIHLKISSSAHKEISDHILIYLSEDEAIRAQLHIGQRAGIRGRLSLFKSAYNRGQFDMRKYYMNKHYAYVCYDGHVEYKGEAYDLLRDVLYRIRLRTAAVYERYYEERYSGIVKALVLAERSGLDEDVKEQYKNAGISHILALSGLHIVTMGFIIFGLLVRTGILRPVAAAVSVVLTVLYCIMTGMPTSAVRALIMFLISMGAVLAGRTNDIRTAAALAALIMLIVNPSYLYETGFQLSFAAVIGIGLVYPAVRVIVQYIFDRDRVRRLHRSDKKRVRAVMTLLRTLMFSLSLQMTIVPLTMWYYYQLSTYGIIANLLVIPLADTLLIGCLITGIAGNIVSVITGPGSSPAVDMSSYACSGLSINTGAEMSADGIGRIAYMAAEGICRISSLVTSWILKLYDLVTEGVNKLPGGLIVTGRPKLWQVIVYYIILILAVAAGYILMGRERRLKRDALKRRDTGHYDRIEGVETARKRIVRYLRIRSLVLMAAIVTGTVVLFVRIQPHCEISALYVGQGQCFVLHGRDIPTVMYDCGSSDDKEPGKYTIVPFLKYCGISDVDTVFISHLDTDHVSGLIEILDSRPAGIRIKRIVISGAVSQTGSENYPLLLEAAEKYGAEIYTMAAGDIIKWKKLAVGCLSPRHPQKSVRNTYVSDGNINDDSLVLDIRYYADGLNTVEDMTVERNEDKEQGVMLNNETDGTISALFTGDISSQVEDTLLEMGLGSYDWLQVAHHGSRSSANERFIGTVSPRMAVVSAGINNQYGHPHEETLKILKEEDNIFTCITAEDGETDAVIRGREIEIRKYNMPVF